MNNPKSIKGQAFVPVKLGWLLLAMIAAHFLLYFPALTLHYGGFEDFQFLEKGWSGFLRNPNIPIQMDVGRPFGALILGVFAGIIDNLGDLNIVRAISALFLVFSQMIIHIFLVRSGLSTIMSFAISLAIFTTATVTSTAQWAAAVQMPVAILIALLSAEFLYQSVNANAANQDRAAWSCDLTKLIVSALLLFVSFLIYPTLALFFIVPFFVLILFGDTEVKDAIFRITSWATAIAASVYVFYFVFIKFFYFPIIRHLFPQYFGNPIYGFDIHSDILGQLVWMLTEAMPHFLQILAIQGGGADWFLIVLIAGACCFGLRVIFAARKQDSQLDLKRIVISLAIFSALFFISIAHLVLAEAAHMAPRVYAVGQTAVILLFFASMREIFKILGQQGSLRFFMFASMGFSVLSFATAKHSIHTTALNQWLELRYLSSEIKRQYHPDLKNIIVVKVPHRSRYLGDDIPGYNWVNSDIAGSMLPAMTAQAFLHLRLDSLYVNNLGPNSLYESTGRRNIVVTPIEPEAFAYVEVDSPNGVSGNEIKLVDMRQLLNEKGWHGATEREKAQVEIVQVHSSITRKIGYRYGPESALRPELKNPDRFWEAGPMPLSLSFIYHDPKIIDSYTLGTATGASGRMPLSWRVEASDGKTGPWVILERRTVGGWTDNESKTFKIERVGNFERYRIVFERSSDGVLRLYDIALHEAL
jgi:hypothetical protein